MTSSRPLGRPGALFPPWALGVFALALAARLAFLFLADQPLLYAHQYNYFTNALRVALHPDPIDYVLRSDEWRTWDQHWTIAPLYHLFAASVFRLLGPHLIYLRVLQCLLDAATAVAVAALGRQVAGPRGWWAGVGYGLYWPALEMPTWTMTENLHTVLLVVGVTVLAREVTYPAKAKAVLGGVLLGLSALARSVSAGFLGVLALWRFLAGARAGHRSSALLVLAGGAAMILPWTTRNIFLMGEPVLIETAAFENLWWANHLTDPVRYRRQQEIVHGQPTPAAKRAVALHFALRGVRRHPDLFVEKVRTNFRHFSRPEGLHNFLTIERSQEPWRHAGALLLDDLPLLLIVPPFVVFLFVGRPGAGRSLVVLWTAYYLLMVVVVFHNEIRYRSALVPFAFAGAAGGLATLREALRQRRLLAWLSLALGLWLSLSMAAPYAAPAWQALDAWRSLRPLEAVLERGDLTRAAAVVEAAAAKDPRSPRPWLTYGRLLTRHGRIPEAIDAYRRAAGLASPANWTPRLALPQLLQETGRFEEAARALRQADVLSWNADPWLALEVAWRALPSPRTDEVVVGHADYGAVRGFFHPRGGDPLLSRPRLEWNNYEALGGPQPLPGPHRWTRGRAWLRLSPTRPSTAYVVTLHMGSPFPSPRWSPFVKVSVNGKAAVSLTLGPEIRAYDLRIPASPGEALVVRIDAPTWSLPGEPAEQGIRVDRLQVSPAS